MLGCRVWDLGTVHDKKLAGLWGARSSAAGNPSVKPKISESRGAGGLGLRVPLPRPLLIVLALAAGSHAHSFLDSNEVTENEARGMHVQQYCKRTSSSKNENRSNKHDNNRNFDYLMQCAKIISGSAALSQQVQVVCRSVPSLHDTSVK